MPLEVDSSDQDREYARLGWRTAIASGGGDCVQVAQTADGVAVRDSKNPAGAVHTYGRAAWGALVARIKSGTLDQPSG